VALEKGKGSRLKSDTKTEVASAMLPTEATARPAPFWSRTLPALVVAMRPSQWFKNTFVLAALVFSRHLFDVAYVQRTALGFVSFCLVSSAVYLFNDMRDMAADQEHPTKRLRPIASGRLGTRTATYAAVVLSLAALSIGFLLSTVFGGIVFLYAVLNVAYSLRLKDVVILDVMTIASGFLLRAIAGAVVIGVTISTWFIICTTLLALFLGFVKRRQELILLENSAIHHRRILKDYGATFLDQMISTVTSGVLLSYAMYTMSPTVMERTGSELAFTIPFVIYGLLRYLYLVYQKGQGGNPTSTVLGDPPLIVNGLLWLATVCVILYR
jgi:4-hydroxybenzoate polyprenyltransferase